MLIHPISVSAAAESAPKVMDKADLLTDKEEDILTAKINQIVHKYQIDIVIATEYDRSAETSQDEADLMYDNNGYGIGNDKNGILFLVIKNPGEWAISTTGNAISLFSDYDLDELGGNAASHYFADKNFYGGFNSYLSELEADLEYAINKKNADTLKTDNDIPSTDTVTDDKDSKENKENLSPESKPEKRAHNYFIPSVISGLIITVISMIITKSGMKTANMQNNANSYQQKDAAKQIKKKDIFLTSSITKRPLPQNNNKPSRAKSSSTVHRSSNGRTHGGSSGKF